MLRSLKLSYATSYTNVLRTVILARGFQVSIMINILQRISLLRNLLSEIERSENSLSIFVVLTWVVMIGFPRLNAPFSTLVLTRYDEIDLTKLTFSNKRGNK